MGNATKLWSVQQLKMLDRSNPYNIGSFVFNSSGQIYSVDEVLDIWEELPDEELFYSVNWESELWSESGIQIPSVYAEY